MERIYHKSIKEYKHINLEERIEIELGIGRKETISSIARHIGRAKSSIREEIRRGFYNGRYRARIGELRANRRKERSHIHCKWRDETLLRFIERHIRLKWSLEIIAALWNKEGHSISYSTIYRLINAHRPEWRKYLIYNGIHKHRLRHRKKQPCIPNRVDIASRPIEITLRERIGDIEADTVISSRSGRSCLAVFVDRKTRYYWIRKMPSKSSLDMSRTTCLTLKDIPVKTITYDNGTENADHEYVNRKLKCKTYFCRPYCSADKGSIENRNKILRQFLPKKTNFDLISDGNCL